MTGPDLPTLLASGERATFHGNPAAAVGALEQAVELAQATALFAEAAAAGWLLGVALGAAGRYGQALTVLAPLVEAGSAEAVGAEQRLFGSLAGSTIASIQRQLGRHAVAREADLAALSLTTGSGEAAFDALLGLASDAIGLDEGDEAAGRLQQAERALPGRGDEWWRQLVRLDWTRAELALLEGSPEDAAVHASAAVQRAENGRAPRHVAKGLLLLGIAQVSGGLAEAAALASRIREAVEAYEPGLLHPRLGALHLGVSIGMGCFPIDGSDFTGLLTAADSTMYREKTERKLGNLADPDRMHLGAEFGLPRAA